MSKISKRLAILGVTLGTVPVLLGARCQFSVGQVTLDPPSECEVVDRHAWGASGLGGSQAVEPQCPILITERAYATYYSFIIPASDMSKLPYIPTGRIAFYDRVFRLIGGNMDQHKVIFWNGNVGSVSGFYLAGSDSALTGLSGTDYGRIRVYLATGDSARGEAFLRYAPRTMAGVSGPVAVTEGEAVAFHAQAASEFRPVSFEWLVNSVSQGPSSTTATSFGTTFTGAGWQEVSVLVTPGHSISPYLLPISVEVVEAGACGGEGQLPCTAPPSGGLPTPLKRHARLPL